MNAPLLEVKDLRKSYVMQRNFLGKPKETFEAVKGVSFSLRRGRTVGIVGESGAGKSTVGRMVLRLIEPTSGTVLFDGANVTSLPPGELKTFRQRAQMIFQDPFSSLDPRMVIRDAVGEPLLVHERLERDERDVRALRLLERVGMRADQLDRYPREFSGGQLQRVAIARALATNPDFIVCDEPVAALDMSIQAQVLNLLIDLQEERQLSYLFISHDLGLVKFLADDTIVMRRGEVVEAGPTAKIFADPEHEYTRNLIRAIPKVAPGRRRAQSQNGSAK